MNRQISLRRFVRATAASGGALALASCGRAGDTISVSGKTATKPQARPSLAATLPRQEFLEFLDATADATMRRCHHCAQATFLTLQEGFGLEGGAILKALTPLPGIAERGETCGAVIGGLMALGLAYGRDRIEDWAAWRASLEPARSFCARFVREYGSTQCGDLHEKLFGRRFNLSDPADLRAFQAAVPGPTQVCGGVVRKAVRLAAEFILQQPPAR